jgi:RNA polymerase sigma-70 factor (ECF subfamily)
VSAAEERPAGAGDDDVRLVARCHAGDQDAWREFVERFSRYVYAITTRGYGFSHTEAEDVFQDVFARAYQRLGTLRDPSAVRPWLGQLTRRTCLDHLRRRQGDAQPLDEGAEPGAIDRELAQIDEAVAVHQAMEELSGACQDILDRFFCRDQSYRTIGDTLGLPPGTIASRISRCLARLKETFTGSSGET